MEQVMHSLRDKFDPIDLQVARFLRSLTISHHSLVSLSAALANNTTRRGHVCLPLEHIAHLVKEMGAAPPPLFTNISELRQELLSTTVVGTPGETLPLILTDENKLYLHRYFAYEQQIATSILSLANAVETIDESLAREQVAQLFPEAAPDGPIDWQKAAVCLAPLKRFLVISGGPGTGKTYTVARVLALLMALDPAQRIALTAPTGKAAARLQQSVLNAQQSIPPALASLVPNTASTLHRLLGYRADGSGFRYNQGHQLPLDTLVIDEASMIDVELMAALLHALPTNCRLILLGDPNQLSSVESGHLFADICGRKSSTWSNNLIQQLKLIYPVDFPSETKTNPLDDCLVHLQQSYRFTATSGMARLSRAVNTGKTDEIETLYQHTQTDLELLDPADSLTESRFTKNVLELYAPLFSAPSPGKALHILERGKILCALKSGPSGTHLVNRRVESILRQKQLIVENDTLYQGRPIIITRNHYELELYNGDTGILWPDQSGTLYCWFMRVDGTLQPVTPARLPAYETAFAITIHKSQGSEFQEVFMLFPKNDARVLNRELLYTGITRARKKLTLQSPRDMLITTINRRTTRFSGLQQLLAVPLQGK